MNTNPSDDTNLVKLSGDRDIHAAALEGFYGRGKLSIWFNGPGGIMVSTGAVSADEARAVAAALVAAADAADVIASRHAARAAA